MASATGMDLHDQYHHNLHQQAKPHQPNNPSQRPQLSYREPSQESSPPPSPDIFPQQGNAVITSSTTLHSLLSPETSSSMNAASSRRGVTPPSPPISVHIQETGNSPIRPSTPVAQQSMESKHPQFIEPTPPQSLKDKITRVFRGRAFSDASLSIRRHKKDNSNSTNTTTISPLGVPPSSRSSVQPDEQYGKQPTFYDSGAGIVSRSRANSHSQLLHGMAPPRRTIMNGGEVRVEIRPWPEQEQEDMQSKHQEDSSTKYYEYYTRSNSPDVNSVDDDGGLKVENTQDFMSCPSLKSAISTEDLKVAAQRKSVERNLTYQTTSSDSQERKVAERVAESMEFEEFQFGLTEDQSDQPPRESEDARISLARNESSVSGQASSTALGDLDCPHSGSHSSLAKYMGSRNNSRPGFSRNVSTGSLGPPLAQSSRSNSALGSIGSGSDAVARELKRLSKISAGSGVSGMAIHVTVDGAGSTHVPEESEDGEGDQRTHRKYTREEKGKDRATSSVPSGAHDQHSSRQDQYYNTSSEPQERSPSPVSSTSRDKTEASTEDDSASLLPGIGEVIQTTKLRAQTPGKGVIVHQADGRFEHTYRMRTLPTEKSILVPQYRYPSSSAFPHRNALIPPVLVINPSSPESGMPSPPSPAHVRTPSIPQGDGMFDDHSPSQSLNNLLQPARPSMDSHLSLPDPSRHAPNRSSWSPSRYLPSRPNKFLRRSLTPHLYSAAEAALVDDLQVDRARERKIGRFLMFACLAFPPLLFVMAAGGMDVFVASWTRSAVKRVGRTEKRIALVLGTSILLAAVVGGIVGVSLAATA